MTEPLKPHSHPLLGKDYIARVLPRGLWVIEPFLPVGGALLLYGTQKYGKSFAALQLAAAIAGSAPDWLTYPIERHGRVLYIQVDTPPATWQARCGTFAQANVAGIEEVSMVDRLILPKFPFNINDDECFLWLAKECQTDYLAVFIDTVREIHNEDEDKSQAMQGIVSRLVKAVGNAALVLIHHDRKPSSDRGASVLHDMRGSSYLAGRVDCILRVQKHDWVYIGRTVEETHIPMQRLQPSGLWDVSPEAKSEALERQTLEILIADSNFTSDYARAKQLIHIYPHLSFDTAKKRVSRAREKPTGTPQGRSFLGTVPVPKITVIK